MLGDNLSADDIHTALVQYVIVVSMDRAAQLGHNSGAASGLDAWWNSRVSAAPFVRGYCTIKSACWMGLGLRVFHLIRPG